MEARARFPLTAVITLLASLVLSIVPLAAPAGPFKPPWAAVALLYWSLASPRSVGLLTAFLMGLALDSLTGSLLGQHALGLLLIVYVSRRFYLQLRAFPVSQLTLTVAALLAIHQFVLFWIDGVAGRTVPMIERWGPVLAGTVLWIFVWTLFDRGRERATARL